MAFLLIEFSFFFFLCLRSTSLTGSRLCVMRNSQRYLLGKTLIQLAIGDPLDSTLDIEAEERRFIEDNWELEISLWTFHFLFSSFLK